MTVEELFEGWRERHPDLVYSNRLYDLKRWSEPNSSGRWEQVSYGEIMDSIADHVVEVEGTYDAYKIRSLYETALVECAREVAS